MMDLTAMMFSLAVRIGAPLIGALLFTQVTMGILAKTVPQMNILMVGFPLTISVGLIFLSLTLGLMVPIMENIFGNLRPIFNGLLRAM
jgi:flagellar biosynthetic protein FliR